MRNRIAYPIWPAAPVTARVSPALSLARSLVHHGQKVVGMDSDPEKVKVASEILIQVFQAEAVDKVALEQLGFGELSTVIVSTGHSMEASILITLFLKELGCKSVTVKAMSLDHEAVLKKVGADEVIGWGGKVVLANLVDGQSTTNTIRRMNGS